MSVNYRLLTTNQHSMTSKITVAVMMCIIAIVNFFYYPKWLESGTEATISWDVSGYYMYLPAVFIYNDLSNCSYSNYVIDTYHPTPDFQQGFTHQSSGNCVMKYSMGQAVVMLPFFALGHIYALNSSQYLADGFSTPYQLSIAIGSIVIAFIGLLFLRKVLRTYYSDSVVSLCIACVVIGTNYLNYAAIDGAMTHNTLFTIYTLIVYTTIRFYDNITISKAIAIGAFVGLAALTRPTEILAALIPILWGVDFTRRTSILRRITLFKRNTTAILSSVVACLVVGSIQMVYWKFVTNDWLVYSYQDQGFSWLHPHVFAGLFSYKSGWLTYSPLMVLSLLGFIPLYKRNRSVFFVSSIFFGLFIYIAFAWDIWWYGGSLGQRTMVQSYPILAIPLAAAIDALYDRSFYWRAVAAVVVLFLIYVSLWFTHQAHRGNLLLVSQSTKEYYWRTFLTYKIENENWKLLDGVRYLYDGQRYNISKVYKDSTNITLDAESQYSEPSVIELPSAVKEKYQWYRIKAAITIGPKEWNFDKMTQFIVATKHENEEVGEYWFRIQRLLNDGDSKELYIDIKNDHPTIDEIEIRFWNAGGSKRVDIHSVAIEGFNSEGE